MTIAETDYRQAKWLLIDPVCQLVVLAIGRTDPLSISTHCITGMHSIEDALGSPKLFQPLRPFASYLQS